MLFCRSSIGGFSRGAGLIFFLKSRHHSLTGAPKSFVSESMPQFTDELTLEQPLAGKKVLFAEDQEHLRTIIVMMLEELGADVLPVGDGRSVLEHYETHLHGIDLILMDVKMSGLAGPETYERLLQMDQGFGWCSPPVHRRMRISRICWSDTTVDLSKNRSTWLTWAMCSTRCCTASTRLRRRRSLSKKCSSAATPRGTPTEHLP